MMAKASLRWKDDKYLKSCIKCGDVIWEKGLLKKGPGKLNDFLTIICFYHSCFFVLRLSSHKFALQV